MKHCVMVEHSCSKSPSSPMLQRYVPFYQNINHPKNFSKYGNIPSQIINLNMPYPKSFPTFSDITIISKKRHITINLRNAVCFSINLLCIFLSLVFQFNFCGTALRKFLKLCSMLLSHKPPLRTKHNTGYK